MFLVTLIVASSDEKKDGACIWSNIPKEEVEFSSSTKLSTARKEVALQPTTS